ncbi:MAG: hypothetical protein KC544_04570 [Gemmatimonadetes bacterium]|nr:hypothetical protein [Gemmatimonadota bacterium]MCB9505358.1 hypothetical protein [Gemmatimonadales bacterium]MCA9762387.1 hypothetical protein [Gemmatimonadota bacterium]MCA9768345.1 hypothetical protein [Gemmatimonadota bacterium]MCB9518757.1 hypothetical protein [Gemmatimonadales bacterium]
MRRASLLAAASLALGACAPTTSTGSLPLEVLVVLDSLDHTLRMIPVDSPTVVREIDLGGALGFTPSFLAARGRKAVVAGNDGSTARIAIVDLAASGIQDIVTLLDGQIAAVAIADDDHAFIGSWTSGAISRINLANGAVELLAAPGGPQGFAVTRGKVFATIGNRQACAIDPIACGRGPSWLIQAEPDLPRDSVPLSGPGNAGPSAIGADGLVYVLSEGDDFANGEGRLSIVDPIRNSEIASFGGVGPLIPSWIINDGGERMLIASGPGGLLVFNTRLRRFTLPFGNGIPLEFPTDLVGDAIGRAYVLQRGGCSAAAPGRVRVFGTSLIEQLSIQAGSCPIAAAIAEVPADRFFDQP